MVSTINAVHPALGQDGRLLLERGKRVLLGELPVRLQHLAGGAHVAQHILAVAGGGLGQPDSGQIDLAHVDAHVVRLAGWRGS